MNEDNFKNIKTSKKFDQKFMILYSRPIKIVIKIVF